mgnify:CR=1 FL=1
MTIDGFFVRMIGIPVLIVFGVRLSWIAYSTVDTWIWPSLLFGTMFLATGIAWSIEFYMTYARKWWYSSGESETVRSSQPHRFSK